MVISRSLFIGNNRWNCGVFCNVCRLLCTTRLRTRGIRMKSAGGRLACNLRMGCPIVCGR